MCASDVQDLVYCMTASEALKVHALVILRKVVMSSWKGSNGGNVCLEAPGYC